MKAAIYEMGGGNIAVLTRRHFSRHLVGNHCPRWTRYPPRMHSHLGYLPTLGSMRYKKESSLCMHIQNK